ncbi:uncharacterized protein LOC120766214 [Bactrocera tryoni]|uniref:uncharacterized protein LOC120766214 n=1 Tax=Bactrocera tryoni TaxID=59916 RepID=UPI001A9720EF|nr:uncharacterized protein LOC120766214 [Bactrocera tryoni]
MFIRQLTCLLVIAICLQFGIAKVLKPIKQQDIGAWNHPVVGTAFDYDYAPEARRSPQRHQKSSPTTTQRPFIRYWNNFIRNIRVPVPTISWNMTNPLVNLFNAGYTNVIDTPVGNYNNRNTKRKRRKKTHTHSDTKHKYTQAYDDDEETYQSVSYNGYATPYTHDFEPQKAVYFYDPSTGQYYKMQTPYVNSYTLSESQQQQLDDAEEEEEQMDESVEQEEPEAAQIEPPTTEAAVESGETENEETPQANEEEALSDAEEVSGEVELIPADVENFDDSEEVQTPAKQLVEATKMIKSKNVKSVEELRNAISAYMLDDRFNRMRQQANTAERYKMLRNRVKPRPKQKFTHYLLQQV